MTCKVNADTTDGLKLTSDTSGEIDIQTNGTTKVHMDSSGNVGIGTSSPNYPLDIEAGALGGTSGDTVNLLELKHTNNNGSFLRFEGLRTSTGTSWNSAGTRIQQVIDVTDMAYIQFNGDGNDNGISFGSGASTEHMRINSSGNVLIGTTSSLSRLTVYHASSTVSVMQSGTTAAVTQIAFRNPNGYVGSITTSGLSTAYNTSSDYRLKENVVDMTGSIDRVKALQPKRFNFIADEDDTTVDGFLAHEVSSTVPEAISGEKDATREEEYEVTPAVLDDDGNVVTEAVMGTRTVPEYQGIDQSKLVPLLTGALQEAITKIEDLETRIQALENN